MGKTGALYTNHRGEHSTTSSPTEERDADLTGKSMAARHKVDPPRHDKLSDPFWRAAVFLEECVLLRPLPSRNELFGYGLAIAYLELFGVRVHTEFDPWRDLIYDIRSFRLDSYARRAAARAAGVAALRRHARGRDQLAHARNPGVMGPEVADDLPDRGPVADLTRRDARRRKQLGGRLLGLAPLPPRPREVISRAMCGKWRRNVVLLNPSFRARARTLGALPSSAACRRTSSRTARTLGSDGTVSWRLMRATPGGKCCG
ncbi:hypothetical protein [Streptomyces noursei]|uniref:hypothetical protein n=1 Tax=Streptomyces noursei TaxID=1971 RepID=UPI0015E130FA